jgi:DNA-directed RNA polymerase specialized sigma24 family protein
MWKSFRRGMVAQVSRADTFTAFVASHEVRLRQSLMAACGGEIGSDAAAEALEYAWANWERVRDMENPVGYLFKVGRSQARKEFGRRRPVLDPVDTARIPEVEPKLPKALSKLSQRQRTAVLLVHGYGWTETEVGDQTKNFELLPSVVEVVGFEPVAPRLRTHPQALATRTVAWTNRGKN